MNPHDIPAHLKLTQAELRLLSELAADPEKSAYGPTGLGVHVPAARRRCMKRGFISPLEPRYAGEDEIGRVYDWARGGKITVEGVKLVRCARRLGWRWP
jgi:hypothetical protein